MGGLAFNRSGENVLLNCLLQSTVFGITCLFFFFEERAAIGIKFIFLSPLSSNHPANRELPAGISPEGLLRELLLCRGLCSD